MLSTPTYRSTPHIPISANMQRKGEGGVKIEGCAHTCRYSFGTPFPIKCDCLANTAKTLANFVVAASGVGGEGSSSSPPPIGVIIFPAMAGGSAIAFCLKALSANFVSRRKEKPASSILLITAEALGESIRSDVSSRSLRRVGDTMSKSSPCGVAAIPDSARTIASSDRGGRRYGSHILLGFSGKWGNGKNRKKEM